jgi:hypothetical protein
MGRQNNLTLIREVVPIIDLGFDDRMTQLENRHIDPGRVHVS